MVVSGVPGLSLTGVWVSRQGRPQPIDLAEEEDGANLAAMTSRASCSRPGTANAPHDSLVTMVHAARVEQLHADHLFEELQTEVLELKDERDSMLRALRQRTEEQKRMERDVRMQKLIFHAKSHEQQMSCDELAQKLVEAKNAVATHGSKSSDKHETFDNFRQRLTQILSLGCSTKWTPRTQISVSEELHGDPSAGMEERVAFVTLSEPAIHTTHCSAVAVTPEADKLWVDDQPRDNSFEDPDAQTNKPTSRTQASLPYSDHNGAFIEWEPPRRNALLDDHASRGESGQEVISPSNAQMQLLLSSSSNSSGGSVPQSQKHSQRSNQSQCPAVVLAPCVQLAQLSAIDGQDTMDGYRQTPKLISDGVPETVGEVGLVVMLNGTSTSASIASLGWTDDLPADTNSSGKGPSQHLSETLTTLGSRETLEGDVALEAISADALSKDEEVSPANLGESTSPGQTMTECLQAASAPAETSNLKMTPLSCLAATYTENTATLTVSTADTSAPPGQFHSEDLPGKHGSLDDASARTKNVSVIACSEKRSLARPISDPQANATCQDSDEDECPSSEDGETQSNEDSSSDSEDAGSLFASPEASTIATNREMCQSTGFKMPSEISAKGELSETALWRASVFRMGSPSPLADSHCGDPSMSLAAVLAPPFEVAPQQSCHSFIASSVGNCLRSSHNTVEQSSAVRREGSPTSGGSLAASVASLKDLPHLQRRRVLQDECKARLPCDNASSQCTTAPSDSSRNTRVSARSRTVSEVPFRSQQGVRLPADSLRAHAQDIVWSRLHELEEPPPPLPMGPPPMQGVRLGRTAMPLPPSYAMLGDKLPPPAVVRAMPCKAHAVDNRKEFAGRKCGESRMNSLSGIYGRLGQDHRPMLRVQSLPVLRAASRRSLGPAGRTLDGGMCRKAVR